MQISEPDFQPFEVTSTCSSVNGGEMGGGGEFQGVYRRIHWRPDYWRRRSGVWWWCKGWLLRRGLSKDEIRWRYICNVVSRVMRLWTKMAGDSLMVVWGEVKSMSLSTNPFSSLSITRPLRITSSHSSFENVPTSSIHPSALSLYGSLYDAAWKPTFYTFTHPVSEPHYPCIVRT